MKFLVVLSLMLLASQNEPAFSSKQISSDLEILKFGRAKEFAPNALLPMDRIELMGYLFCALDDPFSEEQDTSKVYPWLREKAHSIVTGTYSGELFGEGPTTRGGGPNGAHSAPSTDLYLAVEFKAPTKASQVRVYVNGKKVTTRIAIDTDLCWIKFPLKLWQSSLRKIHSKDVLEMFPPSYEGVAPSTTGQILKIEIYANHQKITRYFHCWFPTC